MTDDRERDIERWFDELSWGKRTWLMLIHTTDGRMTLAAGVALSLWGAVWGVGLALDALVVLLTWTGLAVGSLTALAAPVLLLCCLPDAARGALALLTGATRDR